MKLRELITRLQSLEIMNLEGDLEVMVTADNDDNETITATITNITIEQSHDDDEAFFVRLYAPAD